MSYVETPEDQNPNQHIARGHMATLIDAVGPTGVLTSIFSIIRDQDVCAKIAGTILLINEETWIRKLPKHGDVSIDENSMCISPDAGVVISFDRYIMTSNGLVTRNTLSLRSAYQTLAENGMLFELIR